MIGFYDRAAERARLSVAANAPAACAGRMECAICLGTIRRSAVGSCSHHFCHACLLSWLSSNPLCPKCREPVKEVRLDSEFDSLTRMLSQAGSSTSCGGEEEEEETRDEGDEVVIDFAERRKAGLTVKNVQRGPGVEVIATKEGDAAQLSGLRVGDIIVSLNGLPCKGHAEAVAHVEQASKARRRLRCVLLRRAGEPRRTAPPAAAPSSAPAAAPEEAAGAPAGASTAAAAGSRRRNSGGADSDDGDERQREACALRLASRMGCCVVDGVAYYELALESAGGVEASASGQSPMGVRAVRNRYSGWHALARRAAEAFPEMPEHALFPPKAMRSIGSPSGAFVSQRCDALEAYWAAVLECTTDASALEHERRAELAAWLHDALHLDRAAPTILYPPRGPQREG